MKKDFLINFFLILIFFLSINFLEQTPFEKSYYYIQALYMFFLVLFMCYFLIINLYKGKGLIKKDFILFLFIIFWGIFYSSIRAKQVFGQPLIYGILSQRKWLLMGTGFLLYHLLKVKKISLKQLEQLFVFLAWSSLIIYTIIYIYLNCSNIRVNSRFVKYTELRGLRLHLSTYFLNFGLLYYFIKHKITRSIKYLIYLMFFLCFVLFVHKGRAYILFIFIIFLLYIWERYPLKIKIVKFVKLFLLLGLLFVFVYAFYPIYINRLFFGYEQMFKVFTGKKTYDSSSNARLSQVLIVFDFFKSNPKLILLGVGNLSHQWNSGFNGIFGYFYSSDIGLIAIIFIYGLLGFLILYVIFVFKILRLIFKINLKREKNCFILTLKYILVFILISSIMTGNIVFYPNGFVIPYFILYFYLKEKKSYEA